MKKYLLQLRGHRIFLSLLLLAGIIFSSTDVLWSIGPNRPQIPILSLTASKEDYDREWYPDGNYWLPVSKDNSPREFLLPVFVENQWYHYRTGSNKDTIYIPQPIMSFSFKIYFDSLAIRPIAIQKYHPYVDTNDVRVRRVTDDGDEVYYEPYAKFFNITWEEYQDSSYKRYFLDPPPEPDAQKSDRGRGRIIKFTATATKPLPNTDTTNSQFVVLFYVKFRCNQFESRFNKVAGTTPIYISNRYTDRQGAEHVDTIRYNDLIITQQAPFKEWRPYAEFVADDYPDPGEFTGLGGMYNREISRWDYEPILPGTIYLKYTETLPRFGHRLERGLGSIPAIQTVSDAYWVLVDPMTVDSGKVVEGIDVAKRRFQLLNLEPETRLVDVEVETDAPWLEFQVVSDDRAKSSSGGRLGVKDHINWIDNDILGNPDKYDPLGLQTPKDADLFIDIICEPDLIINSINSEIPRGGELAGLYVGHMTFKSHTAVVSPVRLRVTFINFRDPFEPPLYAPDIYNKEHAGILLNIRNSKIATPDRTKILFGTGHRASNNVDILYGETQQTRPLGAYDGKLNQFEARWYLPDIEERAFLAPLGFGDFFPNDETPQTGITGKPTTGSRDIRNINDTTQSIIYLCQFITGSENDYPIVVDWNTLDFPDDAILFLTDTLNGALFPSVNMREATVIGGTGSTRYAYSIQDPAATSFKIEYTLPRIINYVDPYGNPIIKKGWNLLSMPVRPTNSTWNVFYPWAIAIPYYFTNSQYQPHEQLQPGRGYFIKYSDEVDKHFAGVYMYSIDIDPIDGFVDKVELYPGWNTIGALTFPVSINELAYDAFMGPTPTKSFVEKYGVWGYTTDRGYFETSILEPGLGYWMKIGRIAGGEELPAHAYLKLIDPNQAAKAIAGLEPNPERAELLEGAKIVVRDNAQHEGNVYMISNKSIDLSSYELPPVPPFGMFDIRYNTNRFVDNSNSSVINLQGIQYPISINMSNSDADYTFIDAVSGEQFGSIAKGKTSNVEIKSTTIDAIKVLRSDAVKSEFSFTSYPNPVVSASTVNYAIPDAEFVTIKLYDAVGNDVMTLVNESKTAGEYSVVLNAANLAAGRYICRLVAGSHTAVQTITVIK